MEGKGSNNLSEKDLAEAMLDDKRVANDIVQKEVALNTMRQEGKLLREDIVNFKMKADQALNQWIESLEILIGSSE